MKKIIYFLFFILLCSLAIAEPLAYGSVEVTATVGDEPAPTTTVTSTSSGGGSSGSSANKPDCNKLYYIYQDYCENYFCPEYIKITGCSDKNHLCCVHYGDNQVTEEKPISKPETTVEEPVDDFVCETGCEEDIEPVVEEDQVLEPDEPEIKESNKLGLLIFGIGMLVIAFMVILYFVFGKKKTEEEIEKPETQQEPEQTSEEVTSELDKEIEEEAKQEEPEESTEEPEKKNDHQTGG